MEGKIQEALKYIEEFPRAKIAAVAREFGVPRGRLRYCLKGRTTLSDRPPTHVKLTAPKEKALCRYIDPPDCINLAVRAEFVTDAANAVLKERCGSEEALTDPDPDLRYEMSRFIRGSLTLATELIQTKRDLGRTKMAEHLTQQRKALKNTPVQSGGVLTVAQGREMVRQKEDDQLAKARKTVEAAELKAVNARKRAFEEAAEKARKWRVVSGSLDRAEVVDSEGGRRPLKRF